DRAGSVRAGWRQCEAENLAEEAVRHLHEDAGAVARVRLAAARAAVLEIDQDFERAGNDRVRSPAGYVNDEAYAARIVLERGIVKTDPLGRNDIRSIHAPFMADLLPLAK